MDGATRALAGFAGNDGFDGVRPTHRAAYSPSYPEYAVPLLRRINKFQKSVLTPAPAIRIGTTPNGFYRAVGYGLRRPPFSWLLCDYHPVSTYVEKTFRGRFDESNRKLAEITGHSLDLGDYGVALRTVRPSLAATVPNIAAAR